MFKPDTLLNGKPIAKLPICGLFSIHLITKVDLNKVFTDYKTLANAKRFNGKTIHKHRVELLSKYGIKFTENVLDVKSSLKNTIKKYYRGSPLMLRVSGHVVTYMNDKVYDQSNPNGVAMENFSGKNKRVTHIVELKK
jgi:hypothetical protein